MARTMTLRDAARALRNVISGHGLDRTTRAVLDEGLTYLAPAKLRRIQQALAAADALPGGYAEFGVALGGSAILIARHAQGRRFDGFDVFEMIPEPSSEKDDAKSRQRYATIRSGRSRGLAGQTYYGYRPDLYQDVCDSFARYGVPVGSNGVTLHRGLFEATWPLAGVEQLAFAHIDCDWYDPVAYCLAAVEAVLVPGGVIVIDDYHDYGGCRTAVDEFLASHADFTLEDGANPILRRRLV